MTNAKRKTMHGFIIAIELDASPDSLTPEQVAVRLADTASQLDGVISHDCEYLGEIEQIDDEKQLGEKLLD